MRASKRLKIVADRVASVLEGFPTEIFEKSAKMEISKKWEAYLPYM